MHFRFRWRAKWRIGMERGKDDDDDGGGEVMCFLFFNVVIIISSNSSPAIFVLPKSDDT